jgi:hypothetical protein
MPKNIGVRNFSRIPDEEVMRWAEATKEQIRRDVRRFWDIPEVTFRQVSTAPNPGPVGDLDSYVYVLNDVRDATERVGLGFHKFVGDAPGFGQVDRRLPIAYVLVDFALSNGQAPSRVFSHEVLEMAVDPNMQMLTQTIDNRKFLIEVGDVLAFDAGGYFIQGVRVSGFGTPAYFHIGNGQIFSFRGDENGDPIRGPLPAGAPNSMGTLLCWLQDGQLKTVLVDSSLAQGSFPSPDAPSSHEAQPFSRRFRRFLPDDGVGRIVLPESAGV